MTTILSPKFIQGELVRKTKELVGYRLFNYTNTPTPTPAVFKSNAFEGSSTPSPQMPYIAIDFLQTLNPFYQEKYEGWFEYEGEEVYGIVESKVMQFVIKVYGSGEDDTLSIASELSSRLKMSYNRDWFRQFDVGLYDMTNPVPTSIRLSDEYRDVTSFNISFSYAERYIDPVENGGIISRVNIDTYNPDNDPYPAGLNHEPDDPAPLPVKTGDLPQS